MGIVLREEIGAFDVGMPRVTPILVVKARVTETLFWY
jgi:hypothetical protein